MKRYIAEKLLHLYIPSKYQTSKATIGMEKRLPYKI